MCIPPFRNVHASAAVTARRQKPAGNLKVFIHTATSRRTVQARGRRRSGGAKERGKGKPRTELAHAGRVALLGNLAASLAHELIQPLAAILSNAQAALRFLDEAPADVGEIRVILQDIAAQDRRASEIINRVRTMMKKGGTKMEPCDINNGVQEVLQLLGNELRRRNVAVRVQLATNLPAVHGDHIQLQQVLLNLVVNGCDAMHKNAADERRLLIATTCEGDGLIRIAVTDRGDGIDPEDLDWIFEPFFSTKECGLGVGLALSRAIVQAHGGRLWAANNPGGGATFQFTLLPGEKGNTATDAVEGGVPK